MEVKRQWWQVIVTHYHSPLSAVTLPSTALSIVCTVTTVATAPLSPPVTTAILFGHLVCRTDLRPPALHSPSSTFVLLCTPAKTHGPRVRGLLAPEKRCSQKDLFQKFRAETYSATKTFLNVFLIEV